jgi:hypothetical protein
MTEGVNDPCGCLWTRDPQFGDVLKQCDFHKSGGMYPGSVMDLKEFGALIELFKANRLDVRLLE